MLKAPARIRAVKSKRSATMRSLRHSCCSQERKRVLADPTGAVSMADAIRFAQCGPIESTETVVWKSLVTTE